VATIGAAHKCGQDGHSTAMKTIIIIVIIVVLVLLVLGFLRGRGRGV
jgi:hypothetical protein